jgi:hypothetical protein
LVTGSGRGVVAFGDCGRQLFDETDALRSSIIVRGHEYSHGGRHGQRIEIGLRLLDAADDARKTIDLRFQRCVLNRCVDLGDVGTSRPTDLVALGAELGDSVTGGRYSRARRAWCWQRRPAARYKQGQNAGRDHRKDPAKDPQDAPRISQCRNSPTDRKER